MSAQYRDDYRKNSKKSTYENLQQTSVCPGCPGSCSCKLGSRSAFDQLQYQSMVIGKPNYAFDKTRKLNINPDTRETYSGMVTPYNPETSLIWPPHSCNSRR